jgi:peptide deformylase
LTKFQAESGNLIAFDKGEFGAQPLLANCAELKTELKPYVAAGMPSPSSSQKEHIQPIEEQIPAIQGAQTQREV